MKETKQILLDDELSHVNGGISNETMKVQGVVKQVISVASYLVELKNGRQITCQLPSKLRLAKIKLDIDSKVTAEVSIYDLTKGKIISVDE